jgi:nitrate reductase cytochrome c-type subunit
VLCHGESGVKPFPADHTGRTNDVCQMCHKPAPAESATPAAAASPAATAAPPAGAAPQIPHAIEGQQNQCLACHYTTSIEPFPADHEGFSNDLCLSCHTLEN